MECSPGQYSNEAGQVQDTLKQSIDYYSYDQHVLGPQFIPHIGEH